mmetsp:Transcript_12253/g.15540  ORF Transcript_12253/g.15540 Transcript_12253/m.15540 type:complete len:226 (-) Transcript_12253:1023-1700(-)
MLRVAALSMYKLICVLISPSSGSNLSNARVMTVNTYSAFMKDWELNADDSPPFAELTPLHFSTNVKTGPARLMDVFSIKSLHADLNESSKSLLESIDFTLVDTPSLNNVMSAFSEVIEKRRRLRFAIKRETAFPASEKSSWRSTDRSCISKGESCSRRMSKFFTKNKSECKTPLFFSMYMLPSFKLLEQDCILVRAISSNTFGSTTRKILLKTFRTLLIGGNHDS